MREIKFRGKRTDTGEWVYGYYQYCKGAGNGHSIVSFDRDGGMDFEVLPETVGQYTEFKDENEKEIYVGDICKCNGGANDFYFEVGFEYGCYVAKMPWIKKGTLYPELKYYINMRFCKTEVAGNCYENLELLKEEKK